MVSGASHVPLKSYLSLIDLYGKALMGRSELVINTEVWKAQKPSATRPLFYGDRCLTRILRASNSYLSCLG